MKLLTLIIGIWIGQLIMLPFLAMKKDDQEIKKDWIEYRCKVNEKAGCNDVCCCECQKYDECTMKCEGNKDNCGQAYIKLR